MEMATKFAVALETTSANNNYSETCSSRGPFLEIPKSFQARKAVSKTPTRLFC